MSEEKLERIDAIELAVTQLADAVEAMAGIVATGLTRKHLEPVLAQVEATRRLIGTADKS